MEGQSGLSELSVISWVSAVEGCPLSGVPLYLHKSLRYFVNLLCSMLKILVIRTPSGPNVFGQVTSHCTVCVPHQGSR